MIVGILLTIAGIFLLLYLESIFWALLGLRISVLLFFLLFRKVEWRLFSLLSIILFLLLDVLFKIPLGSNILIISIPLGLYLVASLFISLDSGVISFVIKMVIFTVYYILLHLFPNLFLSGQLGFFDLNVFWKSVLSAILTTVFVVSLEYVLQGFRKKGNTSLIRLK